MPPLLRPSAPTASNAILCGDPARALAIAQHLMELPRMSNHNRGLWGYHGATSTGSDLTVQGTGIGGPSAVAVLEELVGLGARRVIRVGTCQGSSPAHRLGDRLVITSAIGRDGTSRALGADEEVLPDPGLTRALLAANGDFGATVTSSDLRGSEVPAGGVTDMQTAAILAAGHSLSIETAALLVVTRIGSRPLADQPTEAAVIAASEVASRVLQGLP